MPELNPVGSKYTFSETKDGLGFIISADNRTSCLIQIVDNTHFTVGHTELRNYYHNIYGLYEHHKIIKKCSSILMQSWTGTNGRVPSKLRKWAEDKTSMALAKKISSRLKSIKTKVDQDILDIQRHVFSTTFKFPQILVEPDFYSKIDKYYLKDIKNLRAAAYSVLLIENLSSVNWREKFYGEPYPSLNKTLDKIPRGLREGDIIRFKFLRHKLIRPVINKTELLFCLYLNEPFGHSNHNFNIIQNSTKDHIKSAAKKIGVFLNNPTISNIRKSQSIEELSCFMSDFINTVELNKNITASGIADLCIKWHREQRYNQYIQYAKYKDINTKTAIPPIPLPKNEHIKFLESVGEILDEGGKMSHCVSSYSDKAVNGKSYLFHVEYEKTSATVEVSPQGRVNQSYGPHNQKNAASKYGERVLSNWGSKLKTENKFIQDLEPDIPF